MENVHVAPVNKIVRQDFQVPLLVTVPSEARCIEQGGGERAKRIEWVGSVVDVAVCSNEPHYPAKYSTFLSGSYS